MLLLIAFACFFVMFAVWLIVPNVDEARGVKSAPVESPADTRTMPARA